MTMKLILMRHAKSDWSFDLQDHERPLNKRGRRSAKALGDWLRAQGHLPDQVLCSTAKRTRETLDLLNLDAPAQFDRALYHAGPETLMEVLQDATGDCVLMLGHNPGIAFFAGALLSAPPEHDRFDHYPTGATLVAAFDQDSWKDTKPGAGRALDFVVPRELLS
ncbi:histidine phosphatase family protein [Thalassococcus sp. CAU 1522]|uniref:Histidine phosphatase family protein n=1 Tax=Thalassococcus arenae TaxID=2851652 RepID=A0ABS6N8K8_9RHOB|nr:histidine phosphatase family protein [Thalassococcus arenae]MBV2359880.1 histidine phosphatase family protein [Thalassococcus arenae]